MSPVAFNIFRHAMTIAAVSCVIALPDPTAAATRDGIPQTILATGEYKINEHVNEWEQFPPTIQIEGAMDIWIGQTEEGLIVVGQGPALVHLPRGGTSVWLADEKHVILPSIGWRTRFGDFYLPSEDYCATHQRDIYPQRVLLGLPEHDCRAWFREQLEYRKGVRMLFERRWNLSGYGDVEETLAARAFAGLSSSQRKALKALDPNLGDEAGPSVRIWGQYAIGSEIGRLEFKIPWSVLPPSHSLDFKALRFAISTGAGQGTSLDSGEGHYWRGEVRLSEPRNYFITPCDYPLEKVQLAYGDWLNWEQWSNFDNRSNREPTRLLRWIAASSYVRHADSLDARKVLVLDNSESPFRLGPGLSPRATLRKHFVLPTPGETIVCGPKMAVVSPSGNRLIASADSEAFLKGPAYSGYGDHMGDPRPRKAETIFTDGEINLGAEARSFDDYLLIKSTIGPFVYPMCGGSAGCAPRVRYEVFKVSIDPLAIGLAFHFEGRSQMYNYFDIRMNDTDWRKIHIFNSRPDENFPRDCRDLLWRRTTYCREEVSGDFLECEMVDEVPMPETIHFDWDMACRNPPVHIGESGHSTTH